MLVISRENVEALQPVHYNSSWYSEGNINVRQLLLGIIFSYVIDFTDSL